MCVWLFALVVGGRYLVDPPSTDPAADLGRTVLAIIEGTVADRLRLLRTMSLVKAAIHAATRANCVAEAKPLCMPLQTTPNSFSDYALCQEQGAIATTGSADGGAVVSTVCTEMHEDLRAATHPVLFNAMPACSALLPIMSAP